MRKVEQGTVYLAGNGGAIVVTPVDGKKFTLQELYHAVGGYVESMIPVERYAHVYVNEEGQLKNLPANQHTWTFAKRSTYELNGYPESWRVQGNAIVVRKVDPNAVAAMTVYQVVR